MIDFILGIIRDSTQGVYKHYQNRLTEQEREILCECSEDGELHLLETDAFGTWLRASKKDYFNQKDRAVQAIYLEAFESLCKRGYVRQEGGSLFRLTGTGFAHARRLPKTIVLEQEDRMIQSGPPLSEEAARLLNEIDQSTDSQRRGITIFDDCELGAGKCHYFPFLFSVFEQGSSGEVEIIDFQPLSRLLKELINHGFLTSDSADNGITKYARTAKT